jgi:hypothetical protein
MCNLPHTTMCDSYTQSFNDPRPSNACVLAPQFSDVQALAVLKVFTFSFDEN